MPAPSPLFDPHAVPARLRQILFALLKQNSITTFDSPVAIPDDVDLTSLGLTSIDFLEFVLSVEEAFGVQILETIEPDQLPLTLAAWREEVCNRSTRRAG